jgi:hypothetical protein
MMYVSWKILSLPHEHVCTTLHIIIRWSENVRRVNKICLQCGHFIPCYFLLNFVLYFISSLQTVTISNTHVTTEHENKSSKLFFCFGLSNFNIIPLLHIMFNVLGQHYTSWMFYTFLNNNGYFQGIYALCKHIISLTNFTYFSVWRWNVKFSHVKITYVLIIWLRTVWERFVFQKTEKNNCSKIDISRCKLILW